MIKMKLQTTLYAFIFLVCFTCCNSEPPKKVDFSDCPQTLFRDLETAMLHKDCVKTLKLREAGLKKFPKEIQEFKNLKYLDLAMNHFDSIPDEIGKLTNLTDLITAYGFVKYISPAIGNLKKLRNIIMIDNDLTYLPDSICYLPALEELVLKGNKIKYLPENIGNLNKLKFLAVSDDEAKPTLTKEEQNRVKKILVNCRLGL